MAPCGDAWPPSPCASQQRPARRCPGLTSHTADHRHRFVVAVMVVVDHAIDAQFLCAASRMDQSWTVVGSLPGLWVILLPMALVVQVRLNGMHA